MTESIILSPKLQNHNQHQYVTNPFRSVRSGCDADGSLRYWWQNFDLVTLWWGGNVMICADKDHGDRMIGSVTKTLELSPTITSSISVFKFKRRQWCWWHFKMLVTWIATASRISHQYFRIVTNMNRLRHPSPKSMQSVRNRHFEIWKIIFLRTKFGTYHYEMVNGEAQR